MTDPRLAHLRDRTHPRLLELIDRVYVRGQTFEEAAREMWPAWKWPPSTAAAKMAVSRLRMRAQQRARRRRARPCCGYCRVTGGRTLAPQ